VARVGGRRPVDVRRSRRCRRTRTAPRPFPAAAAAASAPSSSAWSPRARATTCSKPPTTGARDAAKELSATHDVDVSIDWRTPASEDAAKQVEAVEALVRARVDAILLSCTDATTLAPAIDRAVDKGVPVMTFDSRRPSSRRMAYYGSDNAQIGTVVVAELAKVMGDKGTVAILGGNQSATNLAAACRPRRTSWLVTRT
jgi:ribose transport system substrate-binding protein